MTLTKLKYLVFFSPFLLVFVLVLILVHFSSGGQKNTPVYFPPTPTPIPFTLPNLNAHTLTQTNPPVSYTSDGAQKAVDLEQNRAPLSTTDLQAKDNLVNDLGPVNTLIMATETFRMEYLSAPDEILTEILTPNIAQAKADAVSYLESQGMSFLGICHLPLIFYINFDVANSLRDTNTSFSPVPDGC